MPALEAGHQLCHAVPCRDGKGADEVAHAAVARQIEEVEQPVRGDVLDARVEEPGDLVDVEDQPGSLGGLARNLGEAGVNIELLYTTFGGVKLIVSSRERRGGNPPVALCHL